MEFLECQILLVEKPELGKKLTINLILKKQAWFPNYIDTNVQKIFLRKYFGNEKLFACLQ
jgi:hypothetical protein